MHEGPPLAFLLLVGSCVPILAVRSLVMGIIRAKGGQVDKRVASTEIDQLRHESTGFDISFDKRLSEIELQARLAKLSDVEANGTASTVQTGRLG